MLSFVSSCCLAARLASLPALLVELNLDNSAARLGENPVSRITWSGARKPSVSCRWLTVPRKGEPDPLWNAFVTAIGEAPVTKSERGRWNAACKELRDANVSEQELTKRIARYRQVFPGITLTPTAITANWTSLRPPPSPYVERYVPNPVEACSHGVEGACAKCREESIAHARALRRGISEAFLSESEGEQTRT